MLANAQGRCISDIMATMVRLSVNVNKIALLRNSRGGDLPNVLTAARTCLDAGCHGVTVHPRPDARHIIYKDVRELDAMLRAEYKTEFNALNKAGVQIRTYKDTSTTLYIHAKVILADYGVSGAEKIFVGSENFSVASLTKNRELGLTMATASILETFNTVLTSDFTGGTAWTTT